MSTAALALRRPEASLWTTHLAAAALAGAAILALFARDAADIAQIWWNDSTFNHCLLIVPILSWLVWQRLPELRQLVPAAWWPGLLPVGAGALGWLLGEASGVDFARQLGLLFMLEGAAIACLGKAVARALAFPLFYALFLVPFGEEIVPAMQTLTAQVAAVLLGLSSVPAHLEGIFITTPTGYFEVAEACAGVKFLIAMAAFGTLVANVCYRSWRRRLAFLAMAMAVPVFANGVRAWGTIYIAHLTSIDFAAGFDHVFYGFIFFGLVIALILGIGWRYFDRGVDDPWFDPKALQPKPPRGAPLPLVTAAALGLAIVPLAWSGAVTAAGVRDLPARTALPEIPGWRLVPRAAGIPWRPHFAGADRIVLGHYRDSRGRVVDLAIAVFARQSEGRELVGFGQGAVAPQGRWAWTADAPAPPGGRAERIASHGLERQVVSFYRVGDIVTGSGVGVKLETLKVRLLGGPQRAVAVLASSESREAIDAFLAALGPIAPLADRAAGLEP
ncbi:MAG TPA: exosortase A [Allosphingosinicella sp.]|nr:exosortase A [Allosphingosinicella sp.]